MTADEKIRQKLKSFRSENGLTQEQMAEKTGLNESHYRAFERSPGKTRRPINPRLSTLMGMAKAMEISVSELLEGIGNE